MPASAANPLHAQTRLTAGIVARCAGVTLASAPLAWLCATLLSHRTLPEHEKVVAIALTVLALGAAIHYSRQSWTWSGIFLSALLVFPSALDRRCLLLGSLAAPMLTAIALHAWVTRRGKVIVLASMMATLMAALGASALLTPWPGSVNKLVGNAWDVQWSMWDEQDRLTHAKQQWEQMLASVDVKELEQYAKRELDEVRATEQTARRKEHDDYFQEAIGLYAQATESLRPLPRLAGRRRRGTRPMPAVTERRWGNTKRKRWPRRMPWPPRPPPAGQRTGSSLRLHNTSRPLNRLDRQRQGGPHGGAGHRGTQGVGCRVDEC